MGGGGEIPLYNKTLQYEYKTGMGIHVTTAHTDTVGMARSE